MFRAHQSGPTEDGFSGHAFSVRILDINNLMRTETIIVDGKTLKEQPRE